MKRWGVEGSCDEFGTNLYVGMGNLLLTFSKYENHWYFQIYWMARR